MIIMNQSKSPHQQQLPINEWSSVVFCNHHLDENIDNESTETDSPIVSSSSHSAIGNGARGSIVKHRQISENSSTGITSIANCSVENHDSVLWQFHGQQQRQNSSSSSTQPTASTNTASSSSLWGSESNVAYGAATSLNSNSWQSWSDNHDQQLKDCDHQNSANPYSLRNSNRGGGSRSIWGSTSSTSAIHGNDTVHNHGAGSGTNSQSDHTQGGSAPYIHNGTNEHHDVVDSLLGPKTTSFDRPISSSSSLSLRQYPQFGGNNSSFQDGSNSFDDEDFYPLDTNLAHHLSLSTGGYNTRHNNNNHHHLPFQNSYHSSNDSNSFQPDGGPASIILSSPFRRGGASTFIGSSVTSTSSSAFQQPTQLSPIAGGGILYDGRGYFATATVASTTSSIGSAGSSTIPGLMASSTGSTTQTSLAAPMTNIVSKSKLNPNMSIWRPSSAPVGSPQKSSASTAVLAAVANNNRSGTTSPLSSVISPPPLFHLDLPHQNIHTNRSSPSSSMQNNYAKNCNNNRNNNSFSGNNVGRAPGSPTKSGGGVGSRDRQRANQKKQQQSHQNQQPQQNHQHGSSFHTNNQYHHLSSPLALKEVNNTSNTAINSKNYKIGGGVEPFPEMECGFFPSSSAAMNLSTPGRGATSLITSPSHKNRLSRVANNSNILYEVPASPCGSADVADALTFSSPLPGASSEAIRALMKPQLQGRTVSASSVSTPTSFGGGTMMTDPLDQSISSQISYSMNDITNRTIDTYPILPQPSMTLEEVYPLYFADGLSEDGTENNEEGDDDDEGCDDYFNFDDDDFDFEDDSNSWEAAAGDGESSNKNRTFSASASPSGSGNVAAGFVNESTDTSLSCRNTNTGAGIPAATASRSKKREWLLRMNRKLQDIPVGELDPAVTPLSAIMNAWAKTKSAQGASMVEMWLKRAQEEYNAGNRHVVVTTKMYTMAVDAWARSGEGGAAAQRAEALLQHMHQLYQSGGHEELRPTNAIFNAVINAWARSREKIAPVRAEQILNWMQNLSSDLDIQPDKYTFNTVIHAWAKAGGTDAATKAQELLARMHSMYQAGNLLAKPDTISYNVVINAWAKSGGKGAANEAEKLLLRMHRLHEMGDPDVKPNVVTYGAVIDSFAKSGERGAASRADTLLANMIQLHQSDPTKHSDLLPNTYVFNTVINCWAKSKEHDAASKAEEMLVAMSRLHAAGMPSLKPDNFTYTAVIDAWAKSGYKGAASRADQLLDKMEAKYLAGDSDLKPNSYTYNAVICALAKSGEPGAAARAERVLQNMVNRHRSGGDEDIKPTTINFNTVLDAWAKSRGGRAAAERAEEILEWMDRLHKAGNPDVKVDTISFNAVLDAWARSGDRVAPRRAEQILAHMDELYRGGNKGVKPDRYTYNTLINVWAKSSERGSAARAESVLSAMEKRHRDGDQDFKPNTRTYTSVIDAWAKSGEPGAAHRAEQILNSMISRYEAAGDPDVKPNVHTANAVCNACAFSKNEEDREEALQIAFRVFDWLANQSEMSPDSYTYTILLSVCANLLPREDGATRFAHARAFFDNCRNAGYVNDYVLRKLRQTVTEDEFLGLVDYRTDASASSMPVQWTRNAKLDPKMFNPTSKGRKSGTWSVRKKGK